MSYVEKNLMPGEELVLRPRYHWIRFVPAALLALLGLAMLAIWAARLGGSSPVWLLWGGAALAAAGLLALLWRWLADSFDEFAVTSARVIKKTGFLSRSVRQAPLDRIQDLNLKATLWGRWLSYGDVEVQTAGTDGSIVFPSIRDPEELRNVLFLRRVPATGLAAAAAPLPARPSVEQRLRELEELKAKGLVTEEEMRERRKAILESI